jgi:hypothetical protein
LEPQVFRPESLPRSKPPNVLLPITDKIT